MSTDPVFEREEYETYMKDVKKFYSKQWKENMDHKFQMDNFVPGDFDPGNGALEKNKNDLGTFLKDQRSDYTVTIEKDSGPQGAMSFGFVDCFVRVSSSSPVISGTLVLKYDEKKIGTVDPDTLHIFKWNEANEYFQLIEPSGVGREGEYVWAKITSAGRYTVIGLSNDTEKKIMLRVILSSIGLLKKLMPEVQQVFLYNMAKVVLGSNPNSEMFKNGIGLLDVGTSNGDEV
jgi:hypothetical protein